MKKNKKQKNNSSGEIKEKVYKNKVIVNGTVTEALPNAMFRVLLDNGVTVLCTVSGKIRKGRVFILPDQRVQVGIEIYDPTKGIIFWRLE